MTAILAHCPYAKVVCTSARPIRHPDEKPVVVRPFSFPAGFADLPVEKLRIKPAVEIFVHHRLVRKKQDPLEASDVRTVAEICARLDGIPGVVAAAAAQATLEEVLALVRAGEFPEGTGLGEAVSALFQPLTPAEIQALDALSVCEDGFDLNAAKAVAFSDRIDARLASAILNGLQAAGLIQTFLVDKQPRYRLLYPVRVVCARRLEEGGKAAAVRKRHRAFYLALAVEAEEHLGGPDKVWQTRIKSEIRNLEAALAMRWDEHALRMAAALRRYWYRAGRFYEASELMQRALQGVVESDRGETKAKAKALAGLGSLLSAQAKLDEAREACNDSLAISRDRFPKVAAEAHNALGAIAHSLGEIETARVHFQESRKLLLGVRAEDWLYVNASNNYAGTLNESEEHQEAEKLCISIAVSAKHIEYPHGRFVALTNQAVALMYQGEWRRAEGILDLAKKAQEEGKRPLAHWFLNEAIIQAELDEYTAAAKTFIQVLESVSEQPDPRFVGNLIGEVAAFFCRIGRFGDAAKLWGAAEAPQDKCPIPLNEKRRIDVYKARAKEALGERPYGDYVYVGKQMDESISVKEAVQIFRAVLNS
ncbi:tetratricopeptide repeat protein [bacterium]|nr:MAG: tetratricopeptide repeat protein [bacterium]